MHNQKRNAMHTKFLLFAGMLSTSCLFAQQTTETLFQKAHVRGGFGGPIFSISQANNQTGFGSGGGGGVVFDRLFVGLFGMGEVFDAPKIGQKQPALGYGGLWMGYTIPSHKLLHLYTSVKIGGGAIGTTDFDDHWEFEDHWPDAVLVVTPEAGLELNVARWFRMSGTVGYRFVNGFDGAGNLGKRDLNAPTYAINFRFGWFSGGK